MALKIVGAGLGRTGTHSLKVALEQLLGGPCYHMVEVFGHPEHVPLWHAAYRGEPVDWDTVFAGYVACVDWPGAGVWRQLADYAPDAMILLSTRESADQWWTSASRTIFEVMDAVPGMDEWRAMSTAMLESFSPNWNEEAAAKAAYERHNAEVRADAPPDRLVEWKPQDGWGPLCKALGVPEPAEPFPLTNTTAEFRANFGKEP
jgi:hypothetical protein